MLANQVAHPRAMDTAIGTQRPEIFKYLGAPHHISEVMNHYQLSKVGWDFDGTIADTEFLHRASFRLAACAIVGEDINANNWKTHFSGAFGKPEMESCRTIASVIERLFPSKFGDALKNSKIDAQLICHDSKVSLEVKIVAEQLRQNRHSVFIAFCNNSHTVEVGDRGKSLKLVLNPSSAKSNGIADDLIKGLERVSVTTYPFTIPLMEYLNNTKTPQGVCTSSSIDFVSVLLQKFGIDRLLNAAVYAGDVPTGEHKPEPFPWKLLLARLNGETRTSHAEIKKVSCNKMLVFENSAGRAISGIRAGATVAMRADNTPSLIAKVHQRINPNILSQRPVICTDCWGQLYTPTHRPL